MKNEEVIKVLEKQLKQVAHYNVMSPSISRTFQEDMEEALTTAIETLKRIDVEKINQMFWVISNEWNNIHAENAEGYIRNLSKQIVSYLRGEE